MRNLSLDQFYKRLAKKIAVVGGYIEDKSICAIIKSCRLKPLSVFSDSFNFKTALELEWIDEYGDILLEIKKKKAKTRLYMGAPIPHITTDLFKHETVDFIINHSKYACIGLFPSTQNFILLLMGTDNYFRCYVCIDDGIVEYGVPLMVGLKILKYCVTMKALKYFKKLPIKSEKKALKDVEWFIVSLPAHKLFMPNIIAYDQLRSILYNE